MINALAGFDAAHGHPVAGPQWIAERGGQVVDAQRADLGVGYAQQFDLVLDRRAALKFERNGFRLAQFTRQQGAQIGVEGN